MNCGMSEQGGKVSNLPRKPLIVTAEQALCLGARPASPRPTRPSLAHFTGEEKEAQRLQLYKKGRNVAVRAWT